MFKDKTLLSFFILPLIIFIAAAIFRIFFLDLIEFKYDEALVIFLATKIYSQPLILFSSLTINTGGFHGFPLFYFIMTLLTMLTKNPQTLSFIFAFINVLMIVLFYFIIRRFYGTLTAVIASLILATSPWSILFSRKIWDPDLVFLFLIPLLYFIHYLIFDYNQSLSLKKKTSFINKFPFFWLFFLFTLLVQLHTSTIPIFLVTLFILIIKRTKFNYRQCIMGMFLGLIPALPLLIFNLTSTPFCFDCRAFFNHQSNYSKFDITNLIRPFQILNGSAFENVLGEDFGGFTKAFPLVLILKKIFKIEYLIPLIGTALILRYRLKNFYLLIFLIFIPLFHFFFKIQPKMYYFIPLSPFLAIVYALFFGIPLSLFKQWWLKASVIVIFLIFITSNLIFEISFVKFITLKQDIGGTYGPIYPLTRKFVYQQISSYQHLSYFEELKWYSFMFYKPETIHVKLGEFFLTKQEPDLAKEEFKKALLVNKRE